MRREKNVIIQFFTLLLGLSLIVTGSCADNSDNIAPTVDTKTPAAGLTIDGDADFSTPWTLVNARAGWPVRAWHSSVVMQDGSIILMGGMDSGFGRKNDVWRSTDNGTTWSLVNAKSGWAPRYGQSSVVLLDGSILLMGGYEHSTVENDVWRSTDNGATWKLVNPHAGWSARFEHTSVVMPDGSIILMGGRDLTNRKNDVWQSTDNGATWKLVNLHAEWSARYSSSSVILPDSSILIMGGYDGEVTNSVHGVRNDTWRSTDNGASWTRMNADAWPGRYDFSSVVMPDDSIVVMGGANMITRLNDIWRSTDMGATWTLVNPRANWPGRYGQSSVALPDGSVVLTGGTVYGIAGGDVNDVWRWTPALSTPKDQPDGISIVKTIRPVSIKQGTDAVITITVLNRGTTPVHDVEILDTTISEFPVVEGVIQDAVPLIEPNETRILTYKVHATKPGSFRLTGTKVMYADQYGNYQISYSNSEKIEVLAPLIPPTPENETDEFVGHLFAWFNGIDRSIESMFGDRSGST